MRTIRTNWVTCLFAILFLAAAVFFIAVPADERYLTLCLFTASAFSAAAGLRGILKKKKTLFLQILLAALICNLLIQAFAFCNRLAFETNGLDTIIGMLSSVGFMMFLFSADYGALDSLADSHTKELRKYRIAALVVAALVLAGTISAYFLRQSLSGLLVGLAMAPAAYIAFKQCIIPDIAVGFVRVMRPYNVVVLGIIGCQLVLLFVPSDLYAVPAGLLETAKQLLILFLMPTATKGVEKWFT